MNPTRNGAPLFLPLALLYLPQFKAWARIDHTDDDDSLSLMLAGAIDQLSRQLGIEIALGEWTWSPVDPGMPGNTNRLACACNPPGWSATYIPIPVRGVTSFTVDRGGVDVSNDFHLSGDTYWGDFGEMFLASDGGAQVGDVVTLVSGTLDEADVPFGLTSIIFRYGLYIWENRESASEKNLSEVPDFLLRAWSVYWTPRV